MVVTVSKPDAAPASAPSAPRQRRAIPWHLALLAAALIFGGGLRFYNLNWDDGAHLHPDEREITMVASGLHWPTPADAAGNQQRGGHGPLDPHFFAYGSLPLYLLAASGNVAHRLGELLTAHQLGSPGADQILVSGNSYDGMNLVGRFLSALFDTVSIFLCYLLGRRVYGPPAGAIAAAGYAVTALAVQQAHFYVVDPIMTFWVLLTLLFSLRSLQRGRLMDAVLSGVCFGCGMATKVSVAPLGLAVFLAQALPAWEARQSLDLGRRRLLFGARIDGLLLAMVGAGVAFVVTEPYAILDWSQFVQDITQQSAMVRGVADLPYTRQYAPTLPYLYWLQGLLTWQMTPLLTLAGFAGLLWQAVRAVRGRENADRLLMAWWFPYLAITGSFYAKFPRYLLPAIPLLCIAAGGLTLSVVQTTAGARRRIAIGATALTLLSAALYCLAYMHIYATTNTRVAASDWIYTHIPSVTAGHQTTLTHEVWDDSLPLDRGQRNPAWVPGQYAYVDLPIYDDDTAQKQQQMIQDLQQADYVIEASEIVRGSILRNPQRYPMTVAYYRALADGRLGFAPVASFRSVPELFGLRLDDRGSDLNWQFYDHPPVTIYRKVRQVSPQAMAALFPVPATPPNGVAAAVPSLTLTAAAQAADNTAPALGTMFPANGLGMRFPVLVWLLTVELLGLLALPWSIRLLRALPDAGFSGGKAVGILLTGWLTWLLASAGLAENTQRTIIGVLAALLIAGVAGWLTLGDWRELVRRCWRLWCVSEAVFLVAFLLFLWIRAVNPDLWQLYRGGEKPMELSYITAILRSRVMPPYDPWFSGTTINYYYFGFYLMAMLFKLTRIAPTIGFNLAIPLLYGLSVQLAALIGYTLTGLLVGGRTAQGESEGLRLGFGRRRTGLGQVAGRSGWLDRRAALGGGMAALLFGVLGNLDSGPYLLGLLQQSGAPLVTGAPPLFAGLLQVAAGAVRAVATAGGSLPVFNYFDRTRVIPFTINEFPFFSFLYADMHPHVIDMPFELLATALAVALVMGSKKLQAVPLDPAGMVLAGVLLGALWPINVWDYPTFLLLVVLAMWTRFFRGDNMRQAALRALAFGAGMVIIGRVAFLPFYRHFYALDSGVGLPAHHSDILHFLIVYGLFFFIAGTALIVEQGLSAPWLAVLGMPALIIGFVSASAVLALLTALLTLLLRAVWLRRYNTQVLAVLLPLGLALAVILGTELIFIKDPLQGGDWQRMNTVFKFGVQAWILLAVSCGPLLVWLAGRAPLPFRRPAVYVGQAASMSPDREAFLPLVTKAETSLGTATPLGENAGPRLRGLLPGWWWTALAALALCAAIYPIMATPARVTDRWQINAPTPSLDGMAFMRVNYPSDYAAIVWLQQHIAGTPVLLEANKDDYSWYSRVSWFTGLPTLLGWDYHTSQFHDPALIPLRQQVITTIYTTPDPAVALQLLRQYHVSLIYVGPLERATYAAQGQPGAGLAKFNTMVGTSLNLLYDANGVQIYRVRSVAP